MSNDVITPFHKLMLPTICRSNKNCWPCSQIVSVLFCQNITTEVHTDFCLGPAPPSGIRPVPLPTSEEYFGTFCGVVVGMGHNYSGGQPDSLGSLEYLYSNIQSITYTYGGLESEHSELYGTSCGTDFLHSLETRPDPTYPGPDYPPCITWIDSSTSSATFWNTMRVSEDQLPSGSFILSNHDPTLTRTS